MAHSVFLRAGPCAPAPRSSCPLPPPAGARASAESTRHCRNRGAPPACVAVGAPPAGWSQVPRPPPRRVVSPLSGSPLPVAPFKTEPPPTDRFSSPPPRADAPTVFLPRLRLRPQPMRPSPTAEAAYFVGTPPSRVAASALSSRHRFGASPRGFALLDTSPSPVPRELSPLNSPHLVTRSDAASRASPTPRVWPPRGDHGRRARSAPCLRRPGRLAAGPRPRVVRL
jgi:hypothetical protein